MNKINLNSPKYTELFAKAPIYAETRIVTATQITAEGLATNAYADKGIRHSGETNAHCFDAHFMDYIPNLGGGGCGCSYGARLDYTRQVRAGDWILTDLHKGPETDCDTNYIVDDATFRRQYEAIGQFNVYRSNGLARIIPNAAKNWVAIDAPWGGVQEGCPLCYFCAPYDLDNPDDLAVEKRYILGAGQFAAYTPIKKGLVE